MGTWLLRFPVNQHGIGTIERRVTARYPLELLRRLAQELPQAMRETIDALGWGRRWYDAVGKTKRSAAIRWAEEMSRKDALALAAELAAYWNARHPAGPQFRLPQDAEVAEHFVRAAERLGILTRANARCKCK